MNQQRKDKLNEARSKLANLSPELKQELISRGMIATVEGRVLSLHNTLLVYLQSNGRIPTVVGGYRQWIKTGRQVSKGQHGMTIMFPAGPRDEDTGDILQPERFYTGVVFDITQTELAEAVS